MRFLSLLILLLMILSLFARISGAGQGRATQTSRGAAAHLLVFHHNEGSSCEDLTVTTAGDAVLSNCGHGLEKQYTLSASERSKLQNWANEYTPVNYDATDQSQTGEVTQLYLNGQGVQQAGKAGTQQLLDFANALAGKITAEP